MRIAPVLLVVLLFTACGSDDPTQPVSVSSFVAGHAKYDDGSPVAGLQVDLVEYRFSEGGYVEHDLITGWSKSTCTNAKGYFSFKFDAKREYYYEVVTGCPYSDLVYCHNYAKAPAGNTTNVTLRILSPSQLTFCP